MSNPILTLFDSELQPEQINAVGKSRAIKRKAESAAQKKKKEQKAGVKKADILDGWAADKQYYSIGEVAHLFKVATSNIRFWTKEFDMKVRTTRKGDRLYTVEQIKEIRTIYSLVKEKGFTIAGAKARLKANKKASVETVDLEQLLLQLRNKLILIRNKLS